MRTLGRYVLILVTISFALHFVWESAHIHLYTGYGDVSGGVPITLWASIGDVLYTLAAVAFFMLMRHERNVLAGLQGKDIAVLAIVGFFIALGVEYKALLLHRWAYTEAMPIIPLLGIGLSPVLQMMLLLPFTVYLTKMVARYL